MIGNEMRRVRTHCNRGHEYAPDNVKLNRNGVRVCLACDKMRKTKWREAMNTKERQVDVACHGCGRIRKVVWTTARRLAQFPRVCRPCSRKHLRGKMTFAPATCAKCGKVFSGRSGAARFCDDCAKRKPRVPKECPVCQTQFIGYKSKKTCSPSCNRRFRINDSYFGGRMFKAEGWETKICTICERHVPRKYHIHHVFGHPNHDRLVLLCAGCHDIVSKLAMRKSFGHKQYQRVQYYAVAQRLGMEPPNGGQSAEADRGGCANCF